MRPGPEVGESDVREVYAFTMLPKGLEIRVRRRKEQER
jgi:hypothetical protein